MSFLCQQSLSLEHSTFIDLLAETENLLIVQDLDGVCMGLVKDPLDRTINPRYIEAVPAFDGHFFVLTNGEHIGKRGVNGILKRSMPDTNLDEKGFYLPGLAAGGVQWQDRYGCVAHPGVSDAELAFLAEVPQRIETELRAFFETIPHSCSTAEIDRCIRSSVLDNVASPTANLNTCYETLDDISAYQDLQKQMQVLMEDLLQDAANSGLADSFFIHYAPNLGRDSADREIVWFADDRSSGTTDFQFMLRGAIKEAGVLALLNRYYYQRTGKYPLGENFNVRQAPKAEGDLLALLQQNCDPNLMPTIVGVGDTVTSQIVETPEGLQAKRGGSDRNFLQLVQSIGRAFDRPNLTVYVDSSGGELKNRKPIKCTEKNGKWVVIEGPGDPRDSDDPLTLNVAFPGGHSQYCKAFQQAAKRRSQNSAISNESSV
ncbi:MAG TPA: glucosylglycerol 3-phosphatase [Oscillatoriales cyanobacterium M59_W2019_021]|nr:glucosylglycerol 3-phosphatase [Oscillatoriales cyanobacterium M4454_W2019_049]HIK51312.1 glucosylglycerol 3-phosphatase [Oscillatoriales cyanobacterium M59_W2019_021]